MTNWKTLLLYPSLLVLSCVFLYVLFLATSNFTPRMYFYDQEFQTVSLTDTVGQFSFKSLENFLGIISIGNTEMFPYPISDVIFRIRPAESQEWIIENHYIGPDLSNSESVLFGLPVQEQSKDTTYIFELEVICIEEKECILQPDFSHIVVRHYFSREFLFSNPLEAVRIVASKVYENFLIRPVGEKWVIILVPLILYFSIYLLILFRMLSPQFKPLVHKLTSLFSWSDLFLTLIIGLDIFLQNTLIFYLLLVILLVYLFVIKRKHLIQFNLLMSGVCYYMGILIINAQIKYLASRLGLWAFVFFSIGVLILFARMFNRVWQPKTYFDVLRMKLKRAILERGGNQNNTTN